jgi:ubiquitin conjugation factor E4 B
MSEFIKFAGRLLNDVTFLLDEMLTKLAEIKRIQQEQSRVEEWQAMTQERRQDRLSVLRSAESQASSWSYYSSSMIVLLIEFTSTTRGAFISGEIVGRLAATLNYVLDMLAGSRSSDLRTNDMEKYGFNPAQLLSSVLSVYLNLAEESAFIQAVAMEGRSYKKELFEKAGEVALRKVLKTIDELEQLRRFVNKVEDLRQAMDEEEIDEFPDEFQGVIVYDHWVALLTNARIPDPIMCTLMREPVLLPASKVIVDLSSIKGHLLSDPTDPFSRIPLKVEDVIPRKSLHRNVTAVDS